jgi:predicted O-methyltransferase YrrM
MSSFSRLRTFLARYAYTAPRIGYALTAGLATRRSRHLLWELSNRVGFTECRGTLPTVPVASLVDASLPVVLREADGADGNVSARELIVLAQLVRSGAPRRLFEIGTFDGRTTLALAANSTPDAVVHTLDLPPGVDTAMEIAPSERAFVDKPASGIRVHGTDLAHKVRQLYGDSATFDVSPYPSDFVFVDGSHAYEYVVSDSAKARAMLAGQRGTIVWHDYGMWPGVTRALNELQRRDTYYAGMVHVAGTTLAVLTV